MSGASVVFAGQSPSTADASGGFSLTGSGTVSTKLAVTLSAAGYISRATNVRSDPSGRRDIALDILPDRPPFSLAFYRELVRNGFEAPDSLEPLRRWTTPPNFYIDTFNPKTGQPIDASELAVVISAIQQAVPQLTGGAFGPGTIESGNGARPPQVGTISLQFVFDPGASFCGQAHVGANPGDITINYDRCANVCGSQKVTPEAIAHEVGHAMGFWHTKEDGIMNPFVSTQCGNVQFSGAERVHARLAYLRPPGNLDIDNDPASFQAIEAPAGAPAAGPLVICRR